MHPTVADVASPFLPSIRHAKSAPPCKAKTLANAQVFRASTAEIYPLNSTKTQFSYWRNFDLNQKRDDDEQLKDAMVADSPRYGRGSACM